MCIGYDPFKWGNNFESEEEYLTELLEQQAKYPQCEHISKQIDVVLEKMKEMED